MVQKSGALLALSYQEDEYYRNMGKMFYQAFGIEPPQLVPFFYLQEGDLSLGVKNKVNIKVLLTPGHSPGSISLYWEDRKVLISGDVVFFSSVGRTDFPGGSSSLLRKSIERLSQLDVDDIVPGHSTEVGNIISGKEKVKRNFQMVKMFI